jgi:carboxypeptidase family protein
MRKFSQFLLPKGVSVSQALRFSCLLAALALLGTISAMAQFSDGKIVGTVYDSSKAAIPGATVVVKNQRTGEERTVVTNEQGAYAAPLLKPSTYAVTVSASGFENKTLSGIGVGVGQGKTVDFIVNPAGQNEQITVSEMVTVDTTSARIGVNVTPAEVKGLPLNGRQVSQLYLLTPGAVNNGTGTFDNIRFSGRANQQNAIRYDGVDGTGVVDASPGNLNGETSSTFRLQSSLENIQEFRVDSNNYPAEYGTGTGGQISVVTKSGSNQVHGSAFHYFRNDALDARNFFDREGKSKLRLNQFGGSVGGPIVKDKAFFFASYEGNRQRNGLNFLEAVPSDVARARAVPSIVPALVAFPKGNFKTSDPDFDVAYLQANEVIDEDAVGLRLDFKPTSKDSLYFRFFRDQASSDAPEGVTGRRAVIAAQPQNGVLSWQRIVSASVINEFKVGYNGAWTRTNGVAPTVPGIDLSSMIINITGSVANPGISGQGASAGVAVPGGLLRANSATNGRGQPYTPYTISFINDLSWIKGNHTIKFGAEFRPRRLYTDRQGGTTYSFSNLNAFLNNQPSTIQFLGDVSAPSPFNNGLTGIRLAKQEYYIGYAQDEWKLRPNLTFNYGLRYEYYTPLRERNNGDIVFDPGTGVILPSDTPFFKSTKTNFLPRLSMTWSPGRFSNKTVIRWGFGLNSGPGQTEDQIQPIESDRISVTQSGGAFPINPQELIAKFDPNNLNGFQPRAYDRGYRLPERVAQWSISIQQELPWQTVLTTAYVGSVGRHLFTRSVSNLITGVGTNPTTGAAIITRQFGSQFAEVDTKATNGTDNYNALQTTLNRRFGGGFTLGSQWTWAHSLGTTAGSNEAQTQSNPFDLKADYGNNNFDVRHSLNVSLLYELPFGSGRTHRLSGVSDVALGGWELGGIINARTGVPVDLRIVRNDVVYRHNVTGAITNSPIVTNGVVMTTAIINTPGGGSSRNVRRPDVVPGVDPFLNSGNGLLFLNPAAFSTPQPGSYGNYVRNTLHGPGIGQFDLTLGKRFRVVEGQHVEFHAEFYNLFNRANFASPPGVLANALGTATNQLQPGQGFSATTQGNSTFGIINSTVGRGIGLGTNRQIQLSLRYTF